MSELANLDALLDTQISGEELNEQFRQELTAHRQFPGAWPAVTQTIASGRLEPTSAFVVVQAEGGEATDELDLISTAETHNGMELKIIAAAGKTITVRHRPSIANGIALAGGADKALTSSGFMLLKRYGDHWEEIVNTDVVTVATRVTSLESSMGDINTALAAFLRI